MLCSSCHGQHFVIRGGQMVPCMECGGVGEIHCCDGLTAQPDDPPDACPDRPPQDTPTCYYRPAVAYR